MATRRLSPDEMYFIVTNTTGRRTTVAGLNLGPGQHMTVPARYVSGLWNRCLELADGAAHSRIAVTLIAPNAGLDVAVPVGAAYLRSLQAATAGALGIGPTLPTALRPNPALVDAGFAVLDATTHIPNISDGTIYRDPTGVAV
jgi:hypothetical protein